MRSHGILTAPISQEILGDYFFCSFGQWILSAWGSGGPDVGLAGVRCTKNPFSGFPAYSPIEYASRYALPRGFNELLIPKIGILCIGVL